MTEPPPIDLDEIRARLGPTRAALVLQHRTDGEAGQIVAALITAAGVVAAEHDLEPETTAAITKFAENLRQARPNDDLFDLSAEEGIGVEHLLPTEVVDGLGAAETLVVVPHGVLHLLSVGLPDHRVGAAARAVRVGILPNLASLPLLDGDPATGSSVALIGAADCGGRRSTASTESPLEIADVAALSPAMSSASTRRVAAPPRWHSGGSQSPPARGCAAFQRAWRPGGLRTSRLRPGADDRLLTRPSC